MSLDQLMNQTVVLRRLSGETRDEIGGATLTYTSIQTTMYLEPTQGTRGAWSAGQEDRAERNTPTGDWLGLGRPEVDFDSWDQIVYGDHVLDIVAPPRREPNPRLGTISHVELSLQEVT